MNVLLIEFWGIVWVLMGCVGGDFCKTFCRTITAICGDDICRIKNIQKQSSCNRVTRITLKKKLDNGAFESKKLKREKVKEVLLSFRRSLQNVGSECIESNAITFDYV